MNKAPNPAPRVVLDTNVLLSALVFTGGIMARFRTLWTSGLIETCASKQTVEELIRVLASKKFKLNSQEQASLLADYLPFAQVASVAVNAEQTGLPICRDLRDQIFLTLAQASQVDVLVTGDQDLLVLVNTPNLPFSILKPAEFLIQYQLMS